MAFTTTELPQFITEYCFLQYSTLSHPYKSRLIYQMQPVTTCAISAARFVEISKSYACRTKLIDGYYQNGLPLQIVTNSDDVSREI